MVAIGKDRPSFHLILLNQTYDIPKQHATAYLMKSDEIFTFIPLVFDTLLPLSSNKSFNSYLVSQLWDGPNPYLNVIFS